ncbi:MAG: glycosyl hydrolase family 18 protein [Candidatus Dojkabacteria bacterium]
MVLILAVVSGLGYLAFTVFFSSTPTEIPEEIRNPFAGATQDEFTPNPDHKLDFSGWIPDWASVEGESSFSKLGTLFSSISPVFYEVNPDGSLIQKIPANAEELKKLAKDSSTEYIPAIAMFDHELFSKVLQSEENVERHVNAIYREVIDMGYDGIDLDYESTKLVDKEKYFEFLEELSDRLHVRGKKLVVTVLAQWGDDVVYPSLPETRQVQDWERISGLADEIRIMAYDFTAIGSKFPGPIAPTDWVQSVLEYALTKIPREKIVLGVHLYSYEWFRVAKNKKDEISPVFTPDSSDNPVSTNLPARSYTYGIVSRVLNEQEGEQYEFQGEQVFTYQKRNSSTGKLENRVLVFIDPAGVLERIEMARKENIKGVVFWRLGGEQDLLSKLTP